MTFELFCPVFNESYILPYLVQHYERCVGKGNITFNFYDNGSSDNTVEVAAGLGCNVGVYETGGEIRDDLLMNFKNNIWKGSKADFVIVCDCDEFVEIFPSLLEGKTLLPTTGFNMVGNGSQTPDQITDGCPASDMGKTCVFSPKEITEINYAHGAHTCNPSGNIIPAVLSVLFHMKFISEDHIAYRYKLSRDRLSAINKKHQWGFQYEMPDDAVREMYWHMMDSKVKVRTL